MLIACWGVPGRSYPDNGNRCLAAAVEIHASLQVRDMKTSMGITTGHVSSTWYYTACRGSSSWGKAALLTYCCCDVIVVAV